MKYRNQYKDSFLMLNFELLVIKNLSTASSMPDLTILSAEYQLIPHFETLNCESGRKKYRVC